MTARASQEFDVRHFCEKVGELLCTGSTKLEDMAAELNMSPRTLQRRLAKLGTTHSELVIKAKMVRACQLLSQPNLKIQEIALETGFRSTSSFSRAFQRWSGIPPSEFRKTVKSEIYS